MRHFIDLAEWSSTDIKHLLKLATHLKTEWQTGGNRPVLAGKTLAMVFQKPSLRTRVSFDVGMQHLGGYAVYVSPQEIGLGERESIADVARVLSGFTQAIMARVFAHDHLVQLARWSRVPVINGLSDHSHPCQTLADLLTIDEHFGRLEGIRIAYVGDTNNVTRSLAVGAARVGIKLTVASPAGYAPDDVFMSDAEQVGLALSVTQDPAEAVHDADVIYTDAWFSMGQEAEAEARRKVFPPYQVNAALLRCAPDHAIVMHDLPAHRGDEVTDDVADGPQSVLFQQAENRLHAQKAILVRLLTH